jgi:hypothetical protein
VDTILRVGLHSHGYKRQVSTICHRPRAPGHRGDAEPIRRGPVAPPKNTGPNQITSLDAAMSALFHVGRQRRGACEFQC